MNFIANVPDDTLCQWDFGSGTFDTADTDKKCNPGYVKFSRNSEVFLTVTDPNNASNTKRLSITVTREDSVVDDKNTELNAQIRLQGTIGSNKRLVGNELFCEIGSKDACSVNLTGEDSLGAKTFAWNFGQGETDIAENPTTKYFPLGDYEVHLQISN